MKKQKENSHEGITWSEMGKQNVQAEKVYSTFAFFSSEQSVQQPKNRRVLFQRLMVDAVNPFTAKGFPIDE